MRLAAIKATNHGLGRFTDNFFIVCGCIHECLSVIWVTLSHTWVKLMVHTDSVSKLIMLLNLLLVPVIDFLLEFTEHTGCSLAKLSLLKFAYASGHEP